MQVQTNNLFQHWKFVTLNKLTLEYLIIRSGYWSSNRTPIPVAIGPAIGHVQGTDRKRQSDLCVYFVLCCFSWSIDILYSIEGIRLLNRIHLRGWGLKLTLTAVFLVALGTKVQGIRSNVTLVGKCISASNCISSKRPFFRSLSSPIPSLTTALPALACTAYSVRGWRGNTAWHWAW